MSGTGNLATQILDVFDGYRMAPLPVDVYQTEGKPKLKQKIETFLSAGQPINFVMLGYPMKSPNIRDKVLGTLPDGAEEVSFRQFSRFNDQVKQLYAPGVKINIASDGFVFNDILEVNDNTAESYLEACLEMAKTAPVNWIDLRTFYDRHTSLKTLREKVLLQHGVSNEELEKRILMDPDVNSLYRGMIRFLSLDLAIKPWPSNTQLQKAAKILARQMMFRNEAYSGLVASEFKDHIRLSMHPSINSGAKYSWQLIPGNRAQHSPWHATLVEDDQGYLTLHRKEAEAAGANLVYQNGRPWQFTI